MPTSTTRLALSNPIGTDPPSQFRVSTTANNAKLDNTALYTEGTLLSRPAVGAVEHGHVYYATDTRVFSRNDGTTWWSINGQNVVNPATGTLTNNESAVVAAGVTVTLPTPAQNGWVSITAGSGATGASPVTINGTNINGLGLSAVSTFALGTPGASVVLTSDGTSWFMISGRQDTGWKTLAVSNATATGAPWYTQQIRVIGDRAFLRGAVTQTAPGTVTFTLPAGAIPASQASMPAMDFSGNAMEALLALPAGTMTVLATAGHTITIDGLSYSVV